MDIKTPSAFYLDSIDNLEQLKALERIDCHGDYYKRMMLTVNEF